MTSAELRSASQNRYAQSRSRLMGLLAQRQEAANKLAAEQEALMQQQEAELAAQQAEGNKGWLNTVGSGALTGAGIGSFVPFLGTGAGAIGGAILGLAGGVARGAQQYRKEGSGKWGSIGKALANPWGDNFEISDLPLTQAMGLGAMGAGQAAASRDATQIRNEAQLQANNAAASAWSAQNPSGPSMPVASAPTPTYNAFDPSQSFAAHKAPQY